MQEQFEPTQDKLSSPIASLGRFGRGKVGNVPTAIVREAALAIVILACLKDGLLVSGATTVAGSR